MSRRALTLLVAALAVLLAAAAPTDAAPPNDPLYARQWGPKQVRAEQAWAASRGAGAVLAVVDAGIDLDHPDVDGKVVGGATFLGCGTTSCGNGDWQSGPAPRATGSASQHGTHVAGIAAAETGNGIGVAGVAPDASVLAVKVLDEEGGSFEDIALGIRWSVDHGADVINLSLGALPGVQALTLTGVEATVRDAIADATARGVVVVAAAGNESFPLCSTPAVDGDAVCVAATDKRELRAAYSGFAFKPGLHGVSAPGGSSLPLCGEDVVSSVPVGTGDNACGQGTSYAEFAGTSMATPHVAGVAALLAAQGRSGPAIVQALETTARRPGTDLRGLYDPAFGWGIVDAAAAVASP
jgi:subtilisin family serine protease